MESVAILKQACWMARKIMEARTTLESVVCNHNAGKSITNQIYTQLVGNGTRVP